MSNSENYVKPYSDILGTEAQDDLEQSLASIIPNYKLYDEEQLHRWETWAKVSDALGMKRADFVKNIPEAIRQFLRRDLTNKIPEIPEAWWWIYFWRLTWNFHFEPDPWFESKWWAWMEVRGKQECLNMTGCQNCLGKNIPVMMADGSKKLSQDVRQGDLLMGPDGTPRRVLILHRGIAPLYKITPKIGSPWVCTGNHKLELECTRIRSNGKRVKATPEEWTKWPASKKRSHKQVHVGKRGEDFKTILRTEITVDPIGDGEFYGWTVDKDNMFLLGDGCVTNNSGKSMWAATFPLVQLIVWEQDCKSYLSGPYKSHTDDKVWAELQTQLAIVKNHGIPIKEAYGVELIENKNEILVKTDQGQGLIKFIASQEAASIIGSKTKDHSDTSGRKGISMLAIDEYVENTNTDFSRGFANFRSNYNSLLVLACNPDPSRALAASVSSFIMPIDKKPSEMRKGVDFRWRTSKGIVIRFAWQNCPNKIIGANRWKYLMNEQRKAKQEHEDDVVRAGQLDAWPFGGDGANTLTDAARQTAAGVFTQFYKLFDYDLSVLALDPAFGGEDPAVYTIVDVGMVNVGGDEKKRIVAREQGIIHGIEADFIATPEFCEKVKEIIRYRQDRGDTETQFLETIRPGMKLGAMAQGAIEAAHLCISKGIRFDCFVYDASQRADCHDWIVKVFGHRNLVWWYEGSRNLRMEEGDDWFVWPVETRNDKFNMTQYVRWSEKYSRVITMIWSFACRMINAGYFANGDAVQRGLSELGARELHASNAGKMDIWSKADIKRGEFRGRKIPKMKSPAWGETLAIAIYFAIRYKKAIDIHNHEVKHHIGATDGDWDQWLDIHSDY